MGFMENYRLGKICKEHAKEIPDRFSDIERYVAYAIDEAQENEKIEKATKGMLEEHEIEYEKVVIDGKLYGSKKAEKLCPTGEKEKHLFITEKGNFFTCDVKHIYSVIGGGMIRVCGDIGFENIEPITQEEAREILGKKNPDKYIELFGEVEEA